MNSLLDSLLPTHAMLATAAHRASASSAPSVDSVLCGEYARKFSTEPRILKYVIVRDPLDATEHPIVFSSEIQHSTVVPIGWHPVSAGHLSVIKNRLVVFQVGSESLDLDPRPQDESILQSFLLS